MTAHPHQVCRQKRRFGQEAAAQQALELQELQQPQLHLRCYHCPYCQGWHLTRDNV